MARKCGQTWRRDIPRMHTVRSSALLGFPETGLGVAMAQLRMQSLATVVYVKLLMREVALKTKGCHWIWGGRDLVVEYSPTRNPGFTCWYRTVSFPGGTSTIHG